MKKIIGIGEIVWDMLPSGRQLGGAPVNFCYFAHELGARSYPVSAVGEDVLGDEALEILRGSGIDTSYIQRNSYSTSRVLVSADSEGIPQYEIVKGVAWDNIECTPELLELMSDADVVCWGTLAQRSLKSRESILRMLDAAPEGCLRVFDINIRQDFYSKEILEESLRKADILKLNEDELPLLAAMSGISGETDRIAQEIIEKFSLKNIIYTKGAVCSIIYGADGIISSLPTPSVRVADTVGAGDSFTATYVTSLLDGKAPVEAHAIAVKVAAFVCTMNGAINPLPEGLTD
ncbi:MAG: carbohydrate kinase [Bacteroidales bacterium]|nr:carbohydrate kinase [Bacteroides sp.]MCM1199103.1 carbohydrate kinase [Clostridium sp.]MCM1502116.1 carbohydrate kinase [Bacteroidales bacterium]